MTITAENIAACQEALYLLRQDVGLPSVAEAGTCTDLEWEKCKLAFDSAVSEVWNAHNWNDQLGLGASDAEAAATDCADWSQPMKTALAYCLARDLAIPIAGRMQDLETWNSLYRDKLAQARVVSLEAERSAITDAMHLALCAEIVPRFAPGSALPRSVKTITDRADVLAEQARMNVLAAHAWNFARTEDPAPACPVPAGCGPYPFAAEIPGDCARLISVLAARGTPCDWKVFGRAICSKQPPASLVYVRNVKDVAKWPVPVQRLYVLRLAADTAQTEMPELFAALEQRYQSALAEERVRDSRSSNTPKDAWGRNHYVDAMRGIRPDAPRPPRYSYHGLI